jgi:F-type H+-transporting ATPase subunit epsilon
VTERFQLNILTPEREIFSGSVESVTVTGAIGEFGVLPGHYPYITSVRPGALTFAAKGPNGEEEGHVYAVGHGFAQVSATKVSIVVSSFENADDIDVAAARAALGDAEKALLGTDPESSEYADAQVAQGLATGRILASERRSE